MSFPEGKVIYTIEGSEIPALGVAFDQDAVDTVIKDHVVDILVDKAGFEQIKELVASVVDTDFDSERLQKFLTDQSAPKDWQVGEAIAQACLSVWCSCCFPWPTKRDLKNRTASLPGTDLVGFNQAGDGADGHRFAFGEVKTSAEVRYPPQVVTKKPDGLVQQVLVLRDTDERRSALVIYLAHRAVGKDWYNKYQSALRRYASNSSDVAVYGLLIRDVEPQPADLESAAKTLSTDCPKHTHVELRAIYLPAGAIASLSASVATATGGD